MRAVPVEAAAGPPPLLAARDVRKAFAGNKVVNGVTFEIRPGETLALIGPNGAGKTTLLNVLGGQHRPSAGQVFFAGRDVTGDASHAATRSGMLRGYQDGGLFPKLTALENVMVPLLARGEGVRAARGRAMEALAALGLAPVADERGERLSGGQRKLADFARCLASDARLVLLDEPTAGVHPHVAEAMAAAVRDRRGGDVAFLIVSHDLAWIFDICPRVICMAVGEILCEGTPDAVAHDERVLEAYL